MTDKRKYADLKDKFNNLAKEYVQISESIKKENNKLEQLKLKQKQDNCIHNLKSLVSSRSGKYKRFSNHSDLEQDGFEALVRSFLTYNFSMGNFSWWADHYIATKISRSANKHSTIKFSIKSAKELPPQRISLSDGWRVDALDEPKTNLDACSLIEKSQEKEILKEAINSLSNTHQQLLKMTYGLDGKTYSIKSICKHLCINKHQCNELLLEAKEKLKEILDDLEV